MATVYSLVCSSGSAGAYWSNLSASGRLRYGPSGSERVYAGISAWKAARNSLCLPYDIEVCEIGDAFTDTITSSLWLDMPCASNQITTIVNNERSAAFHGGNVSSGYVAYSDTNLYDYIIRLTGSRGVVDGIRCQTNKPYTDCIRFVTDFGTIRNCIMDGNGVGGNQYLCRTGGGAGNRLQNCIIIRSASSGLIIDSYGVRSTEITNCLVAKNVGTGILSGASVGNYGYYLNNISIGNGTNWSTATPQYAQAMAYNFGVSGDTPWDDGSLTSGVIATTDFTDYANNDFTAALSSSPQVNAGIEPYLGFARDVSDAIRPNYESATYPNNLWDVGPYEYDHGEGLAPASCALTISAPVSLVGAEIRLYDLDNSPAGSLGTELSGVESHTAGTYSYTGLVGNTIWIQIMLDGWEEFGQQITLPTGSLDFYARMTPDRNA